MAAGAGLILLVRLARPIAGWALAVSGWVFLLFGVFNFFSHIGLVVNTM